jgi:hypothetical protein
MSDTPPALWTMRELAVFLGFTPGTVRVLACKHPERLPPRVAAMVSPRWVPAVCQVWATQQSAPVKRKAGRPRAA